MAPHILLLNPPIYDFAAFDFWMKPYGLLTVAGFLRGKAEFKLFDYLDRFHPFLESMDEFKSDQWGRGKFYCRKIPNPAPLAHIRRYFRRFGLPRRLFREMLEAEKPFDFVLVQTMMTYWYPAVVEVIEDIRLLQPQAKIILGGNYVTLCQSHAKSLGADFLVIADNLEPLWQYLRLEPDLRQLPLWELYRRLNVGVIKLSDGCPFNCTYCSVPKVYGKFRPRPYERCIAELDYLINCGVKNIAFYDDALLFEAGKVLIPFLQQLINRGVDVNLHSPNALNARFVTRELAELMVRAGFKTFYLGFESCSPNWHRQTGSKVCCEELDRAVKHLVEAGAEPLDITAYLLLGHPETDLQQLEQSMRFVNSLGIRGMLADFSPIPGTPDGQACRKWVDMDEPLLHNKTAFPIVMLGFDEVNRLKDLQRKLNRDLKPT